MQTSIFSDKSNPLGFFGLSHGELKQTLASIGCSETHARSMFQTIYREFKFSPLATPWLPKSAHELFTKLNAESLTIDRALISAEDESVKFVFRLFDGLNIETVLIPEKKRITLCVSSQVGCRQACGFCHTGRMGLLRNLTAAEIIGQVVTASRWMNDHPEWPKSKLKDGPRKISNVVFMGMGEPLDNVAEVGKSLDILTDVFGLMLSKKKITVSTAGHLDGARQLLKSHPYVHLALSLHSPFALQRSQLMPINKQFPLKDVLEFIKTEYTTKRTMLIQYILIRNVNDSSKHAEEIVRLLAGLNVKINVIPFNPVEGLRFEESPDATLGEFTKILFDGGLRVMIRFSKGRDIKAACGQLVKIKTNGLM